MEIGKFVCPEQFAHLGHGLKLNPCPACHRVGTLNLHGFLRGFNEKHHPTVRARRIFCSNRTRRPGCGRTFSVFLSHCLVGLRMGTDLAWAFFSAVLAGLSVEKSFYARFARHALSLSTFWRLWQKLISSQTTLRTVLLTVSPPPIGAFTSPLRETLAHLALAFGTRGENPLENYQLLTQKFLV